MTTLKIQGKPSTAAMHALEPHVARWYNTPGLRVLAIVELAHAERMQPAPDADKDSSVTMRIANVEVPVDDQEDILREIMRALYVQRTAYGTLDDEGELKLSRQTVKAAAGNLHHLTVAKLSAGIQHWRGYAARLQANGTLTMGELRHELDAIREGLEGLLTSSTGELPLEDD